MPLRIPTQSAQAGMCLAESFEHNGRIMLPAGKTLTEPEAAKLCSTFGGFHLLISDPILDNAVDFEDDSHDRHVADTVQGKARGCFLAMQPSLATGQPLSPAVYGVILETIDDLVRYVDQNPVSSACFSRATDPDDYLSVHAANVFYLSLLMAASFRSTTARTSCPLPTTRVTPPGLVSLLSADLVPLGLGAMFMDAGMVPLQHLFRFTGRLSFNDRKLLARHPVMGTHVLPRSFPSTAKMIIRTHHENFDATGYPDAVPGDRQHVFTRIVRIADAYTAATAQRVYQNACLPAQVLWEMALGPYERCYDPVLVKVLASLIQPFPLGSMLRLTDGRTAVVVKHNYTNPFEPVVVVTFDAQGHHLPSNCLEGPMTLDDQGPRIESYEDKDMSFIYDTSPRWPSVHGRGQDDHPRYTNLFEAAFP